MTVKIEEIYEKRCSETANNLYYQTYSVVKSRLAVSYYPSIKDVQPFMPDHSANHVDRILEKLSRLLQPHLPIENNPAERIIDMENLNLLMHAVLWHDVGNIYGRIDHQKNIIKVFNEIKTFLYDPMHQEWIIKIGEAHSGANGIERGIEDASVAIHDFVLYPRFLSALLRFADEMDEDERRIETRRLADIPKSKEAYWTFCSFNQSIQPVYVADTLGNNMTLEIRIKSKIPKGELLLELGKNGATIMAMKEYINRIEKINTERIYCNRFLSKESALYFHPIDRMVIDIDICDEHSAILDKIQFIFNDSTKATDFFSDANVGRTLSKYGI